MNCYFLKYLLSQTLLFIAIFIIVYPLVLKRFGQTIEVSNRPKQIDSTKNVSYLIHISDIHINQNNSYTTSVYKSFLETASLYAKPIVVLTGDCAHNMRGEDHFYSHQIEGDYQFYRNLTLSFLANFSTFIDLAGNHDEFDLFSASSPNHLFLKYSIFPYSLDNFSCFTYSTADFVIVGINPFSYPFPHGLIDVFVQTNNPMLEKIEEIFQSIPPGKLLLLLHISQLIGEGNSSSEEKVFGKF
jgi:hypothetical protein